MTHEREAGPEAAHREPDLEQGHRPEALPVDLDEIEMRWATQWGESDDGQKRTWRDDIARLIEEVRRRRVPAICGVICPCGPNGEPLACGFPPNPVGELMHRHSWATLPTFAANDDRETAIEGLIEDAIADGLYTPGQRRALAVEILAIAREAAHPSGAGSGLREALELANGGGHLELLLKEGAYAAAARDIGIALHELNAPSAPGDSLAVERALRIVFSQYAVVPDRERIDGPHVVIIGNAHEAARHLAPMVAAVLRSEPTGATPESEG